MHLYHIKGAALKFCWHGWKIIRVCVAISGSLASHQSQMNFVSQKFWQKITWPGVSDLLWKQDHLSSLSKTMAHFQGQTCAGKTSSYIVLDWFDWVPVEFKLFMPIHTETVVSFVTWACVQGRKYIFTVSKDLNSVSVCISFSGQFQGHRAVKIKRKTFNVVWACLECKQCLVWNAYTAEKQWLRFFL